MGDFLFDSSHLEKDIDLGNAKFTIKVVTPACMAKIGRTVASKIHPLKAESFLTDDLYFLEVISTLMECVKKAPDGWNYDNPESWHDRAMILELYAEVRGFTDTFEEKLKKNRSAKRGN